MLRFQRPLVPYLTPLILHPDPPWYPTENRRIRWRPQEDAVGTRHLCALASGLHKPRGPCYHLYIRFGFVAQPKVRAIIVGFGSPMSHSRYPQQRKKRIEMSKKNRRATCICKPIGFSVITASLPSHNHRHSLNRSARSGLSCALCTRRPCASGERVDRGQCTCACAPTTRVGR